MEIQVTINQDETTVTCPMGNIYRIGGLIVKKPDDVKDAFYTPETSMCRAVVFKGLKSNAIIIDDKTVHLI